MKKDFNFKLTIRSIVFYEHISGKSFFELTDEDNLMLIYAIFSTSNQEERISFESFQFLFNNEKFSKEIAKRYSEELKSLMYLVESDDETEKIEGEEKKKISTMTDISAMLIVQYGMDAHYVMDEMQLYEFNGYAKAAENKIQNDLETQRMFTYLNILPHVDGKKLKSPQKLLPFPWEKDEQKEEFENIKNSLGNIFGGKKDGK